MAAGRHRGDDVTAAEECVETPPDVAADRRRWDDDDDDDGGGGGPRGAGSNYERDMLLFERVSDFFTNRQAAWYMISAAYVCLYVRLFVCNTITFESQLDVEVYFRSSGRPISGEDSDTVSVVYEGHRVKVKVTVAKKFQSLYFCNVKLPSAITLVL